LWDDDHNGSADVGSTIQLSAATDFIILGALPLGILRGERELESATRACGELEKSNRH